MLTTKLYLQITGIIVFIVGFVHVLRLINGWAVIVAGWIVPIWISIFGVLVAWYLAYNAVILSGKIKEKKGGGKK